MINAPSIKCGQFNAGCAYNLRQDLAEAIDPATSTERLDASGLDAYLAANRHAFLDISSNQDGAGAALQCAACCTRVVVGMVYVELPARQQG